MTAQRSTLEKGWSLLADGLHIHRFYLSVEPARERHLEQLHEQARGRWGDRLPDLGRLRTRLSDALLEHLLHPAQRAQWPSRPFTAPRAALPVAGVPVVFAQAPHLTEPEGIVDADFALHGEPAIDPGYAQRVERHLDAADLGYLVPLCAEVVVHGPQPAGQPPLGTIYLAPPDDTPVMYGLRLVAAAARALMTAFIRADTVAPESERTWQIGQGEAGLPRDEVAARSLETGLSLRYLAAQARRYDAVLDSVAAAFCDVNAADLLVTSFPGSRQFAKYADGGGAGQH